MKKILLLSVLAVILGSPNLNAQSWLRQIPTDAGGRLDYMAAKMFVESFRNENPATPLPGEKQFLRSKFFLEGRIQEDGSLPVGIYWEEAKRVISERTLIRSPQTPWVFIGPDNSTIGINSGIVGGSGRIDCIAFHPTDPNIFYVGAPCGGMWKTTDGGGSWEPLTDGLPTLGISDIDLDPEDPNTIFICTGTRDVWWETFSVGILKSEDGGITWQETGLQYEIQQNRAVHELWICPTDPLKMVAATTVGLYYSADGGDSWTKVYSGNFMDLEQKPGDPAVIYASTFNYYYCGATVFRSTDSGASFSVLNTGIPSSQVNRITIGVTPADPDVVYALCSACSDNGFFGLYRSSDAGETWAKAPNSNNINVLSWLPHGHDQGGQGFFTLALSVDPQNPDHLHAGGVNIWESTDGGDIWTLNAQYYGSGAQYVHADIHTLAYNPADQTHYNTNDGGVYTYVESTGDWVNISNGLHIMQFYRLGSFRENENRILGSPQDNGTVLFTDSVQYELILAEACDNFFDYDDPDTMYFGGYGAGIRRSYTGGYNSFGITPPGESKLRFNPPVIMHPSDPKILYCGFKDVWRSENRGSSWTNLTNGLTNATDLQSLEVAPSDPQYIYTATYYQIWRTKNGGAEWENIRTGLPAGAPISDIAVSTADPEHIWVTFLGWNSGFKVFHSADAGDTWQNATGNLPNLPANCVAYEPGSDDAVYVGTDVGIYYTNANLTEWIDYSQDLPNVMIDELEIHPASGKILAATYGRGMWWNWLADPATVGIQDRVKKELKVYPNPTADLVMIEATPPGPGIYTISLVNATGQTVLRKSIRSTGMVIRTKADVSMFPAGMYSLILSGAGVNDHEKVIIAR